MCTAEHLVLTAYALEICNYCDIVIYIVLNSKYIFARHVAVATAAVCTDHVKYNNFAIPLHWYIIVEAN
jgi:hypothetical protein